MESHKMLKAIKKPLTDLTNYQNNARGMKWIFK